MPTIQRTSILILLVVAFLACWTGNTAAEEPLKQQLLVDEARIVIDSFAVDPDTKWFRKHLKSAKAALIIPNLYKGAWFIGGSGGRGVLLVHESETGKWLGPAFYTTGSVSFGFQFGGEKSEMIILVMTRKGLDSLYATSVKLGGDISVAVGPVGAGAQGATAPSLNVDYIAYARSKGAFLGISLDGSIIKGNRDWDEAYYGKPVTLANIINKSAVNPKSEKIKAAMARARRAAP
jgi:lipid-binding SYLF domain-containing protein